MLEAALKGLGKGSVDEHVRDLADRVRMLEVGAVSTIGEEGNDGARDEVAREAVMVELERVNSGAGGSHEAQEETEKP